MNNKDEKEKIMPSKKELCRTIEALQLTNNSLNSSLKKLAACEKVKEEFTLKSEAGRHTMFIKLGNADKGWIPNEIHEIELIKKLKAAKVDEDFNIVIFHYGLHTEVVHNS